MLYIHVAILFRDIRTIVQRKLSCKIGILCWPKVDGRKLSARIYVYVCSSSLCFCSDFKKSRRDRAVLHIFSVGFHNKLALFMIPSRRGNALPSTGDWLHLMREAN